jgi:two-component system, LytTR family, response regulator
MMKAVIIEDEPKNVRVLRNLLEENCPNIQVMGDAGDGNTAFELIKEAKPEIVFLDIEIPHGNAFDLLDRFHVIDFEVIFVTAFDDYALRALKYSALDYLLKPVNVDELIGSVKRAEKMLQMKNIQERIGTLLANMSATGTSLKKIAVASMEGMFFIDVNDIIRCEAKGSYTELHLASSEMLTASKNIQEYEKLLPEQSFCRVHNSHIINLNRIKKYHKGRGGYVVMQDGTSVEVASRRRDEFLSRFGQ